MGRPGERGGGMHYLRLDLMQFMFVLRIVCAIAALAVLALLAPEDWRGHFGRVNAAGEQGTGR